MSVHQMLQIESSSYSSPPTIVSRRVGTGTNAIDQLQKFRIGTQLREAVPILVLAYRDQRVGLCTEQLAVNPEGATCTFHQPLHPFEFSNCSPSRPSRGRKFKTAETTICVSSSGLSFEILLSR